jgi:hypothetical protein
MKQKSQENFMLPHHKPNAGPLNFQPPRLAAQQPNPISVFFSDDSNKNILFVMFNLLMMLFIY